MGKKFKYNDKELGLKVDSYAYNNRLAIFIVTDSGEDYDVLTINLSDFLVPGEKSAFLNADLSKSLIDTLKKEKVICYSFGTYPYNYGKYELVKFDFEVLKEYDPKGVEKYLELPKQYDAYVSI